MNPPTARIVQRTSVVLNDGQNLWNYGLVVKTSHAGALSIMSRCRDALGVAIGSHVEIAGASVGDRWAAIMLDRSVSLYEAVGTLVESAKYEEAISLGRPLFEESLMLQWLASKREPLRTAYATWFDHDSWNRYAESLSQVRPGDVPGDIAPLVQHAKCRRDQAAAFAAEHKLKRVAFPSSNDLARNHLGRAHECVHFALSQQFLHGRALVLASRQTYQDDGTLVIGSRPDHDAALLPVVVEWTTSSVLHAFSAVAAMLGLTVPEELRRLRADIDES